MAVLGRVGSAPGGVPTRLAQESFSDPNAQTPGPSSTSMDAPLVFVRNFLYQALFATVAPRTPAFTALAFADIGAEFVPLLRTTVEAVDYSSAPTTSGPIGDTVEAKAFLARTSGLDALHVAAYKALINGLVVDGVWANLDALYIYATQDATTALLNLVSATFNSTAFSSPAFQADRGYTGIDSSATVFINTFFNATTASSPKYTATSAHMSAWSNTAGASSAGGGGIMGCENVPFPSISTLFPLYSDGNTYYRMLDAGSAGVANPGGGLGHYIANRSSGAANQGYKNGVDQGMANVAGTPIMNLNITVLALNDVTTGISFGFGGQCSAASIGGSLTPTQATAFYNRLRTYMTTVGVP